MSNSQAADIMISKLIVDEAMKIVLSTINGRKNITICRCSMSQSLNKVKTSLSHQKTIGTIRFVFLVDEHPILILLNADYVIKQSKILSNV